MARKNTITITTDEENNGDVFFCELREKFPAIAATIMRHDEAEVGREEWVAIQKLDGFADGPEYARHALVVKKFDGVYNQDVTVRASQKTEDAQ